MAKTPDPRLKNFTAKKELIEELIKRFNLDPKQMIVRGFTYFDKKQYENNKTT